MVGRGRGWWFQIVKGAQQIAPFPRGRGDTSPWGKDTIHNKVSHRLYVASLLKCGVTSIRCLDNFGIDIWIPNKTPCGNILESGTPWWKWRRPRRIAYPFARPSLRCRQTETSRSPRRFLLLLPLSKTSPGTRFCNSGGWEFVGDNTRFEFMSTSNAHPAYFFLFSIALSGKATQYSSTVLANSGNPLLIM